MYNSPMWKGNSPLDAETAPKFSTEASCRPEIDFHNVDLFESIQLHPYPVVNRVEAFEPTAKVFPVEDFGQLNDKTLPAMLVDSPAVDESIVVGSVDSHHREEIVKCPNQGTQFPMAAQNREDRNVENDVNPLICKLLASLRLPPEIDAHRHADFPEIGSKGTTDSITWRNAQLFPFQGSQVALPLPPKDPTGPIEERSGIVQTVTFGLHQSGHHVSVKLPGG
jgi:hypothetical protein